MAYKANFKTGWNQREIPACMTVDVEGHVGYLYTITGDALKLLTTAPVAGTKYAMIAQSDDTMVHRHVPVENRVWEYSDVVAVSTTPKPVAYYLVDTTDINYTTV